MKTTENAKLMLVGMGSLGSVVLELLARVGPRIEVVVASRRLDQLELRCRLLRLGALAQGRDFPVRAIRMDLGDIAATAEAIRREKPSIILSTATMSTWWLPDLLPPDKAQSIREAGFGVWVPVHLAPTLDLMRAVQLSGHPCFTITAPFPDVVNCMLGKVGLAPTCGVGNVAEMVPKVQQLAAEELQTPVEEVQVRLVAHHALERFVYREGPLDAEQEAPPFLLSVRSRGKEVTDDLDCRSKLLSPSAITRGQETHFLTAGTTVRLIQALIGPNTENLHVPAPSGLPGGYPVQVNRTGISLDLDHFSQEEAISVNERSHRFDGIQSIRSDGTAIIEPSSSAALRQLIGFAPESVTISDAHEQARELVEHFRIYAEKHGVRMG